MADIDYNQIISPTFGPDLNQMNENKALNNEKSIMEKTNQQRSYMKWMRLNYNRKEGEFPNERAFAEALYEDPPFPEIDHYNKDKLASS